MRPSFIDVMGILLSWFNIHMYVHGVILPNIHMYMGLFFLVWFNIHMYMVLE